MPQVGITRTLGFYLTQTRRLLKDAAPGALYPDPELTDFINQAVKQRDLDLGQLRTVCRFTLTANVFRYPYATVMAGATVLSGAPTAVVYDLMSMIVIPIGDANSAVRYPLARWPYSKLSVLCSTAYPTYPAAYAIVGADLLVLGPPPAQAYPCELDFVCTNPDLVNATDTDLIPYPYTDPVPFLAASLAKAFSQRFDESEKFEGMYHTRMNRVRGRAKSVAIQNPWSDFPLR